MTNLVLPLTDICDIFNYADDNAVSCYGATVQGVLYKLNNVVSTMLTWFTLNEIKVNNNKFQLIVSYRAQNKD